MLEYICFVNELNQDFIKFPRLFILMFHKKDPLTIMQWSIQTFCSNNIERKRVKKKMKLSINYNSITEKAL